MRDRKIAIVYDWMDSWGGVERMLLVLHEMFPEAQWYTSYVDYKKAAWIPDQVRDDRLKTSFMQGLPSFIKKSRILSLLFFPFAFESFDFRSYDTVISVTSSFAKSVITQPHTKHVCILLTPTRWLWGQGKSYELGVKSYWIMRPIIQFFIHYLKRWDVIVAQRPDKIISISQTVADRCRQYYNRESTVVYPPFDEEYWKSIKQEAVNNKHWIPNRVRDDKSDYFLVVSRLEPYKKVDLAIQAFNTFPDKKLIIVGKGTQGKKLKAMASHNIQFIQDVTDQELGVLYSQAEALIMPQEEDFGYVALEAQFFGCPVIAYGVGGACETIIDGKTGLLFYNQSVDALSDAVADFDHNKYNLEDQASIFEQFQKEKFIRAINTYI
ncbi:glycosyltransferase family 4 protein [Candidatus Roizmanbacteria bacterium CG_4_9_14_0_2_um_filter_39_13]|uniref:Glycosyltransferase family 4 protein n=2 Tax=Candidatus Roizmaniibacteriota TaxID=1752723 RepID=A0A2M8F2Y1_9BACT|nr:MAG: glycosyltransferase family 4 protein [Candidatus Roizmanbacteria bacterium CG_4_10_14_0_2_um_filter_39_12]PJC33673.1 MAG: glycosyltransferase family 4 protein [Candidatus Roizmanbacteria bacterium CG_4_9_14_0_2_um_filter_39_13]